MPRGGQRGEETRRAEVTDFIYSLYPQVLSAFYYGHIIVHMAPDEAGDTETFGQRPASEVGVVKKKKKMETINEGSDWTHEGLCGKKSLKPAEPKWNVAAGSTDHSTVVQKLEIKAKQIFYFFHWAITSLHKVKTREQNMHNPSFQVSTF